MSSPPPQPETASPVHGGSSLIGFVFSCSIAFMLTSECYDRRAGTILCITKCIFKDLMFDPVLTRKAEVWNGDPQVVGKIAESLKTTKLGLRM